jgi:oligosaccharyltransferase complex subunit alpha (ribophorin I)
MRIRLSLIPLLILSFCNWTLTSANSEIENKNVDVSIDVSSQLVKSTYKITVQSKNSKPVTSYTFALPRSDCDRLSFIAARDTAKKELKVSTPKKTTEDCSYQITLNGANSIVVETVLAKALQPYPTAITQNEKQLVRFFGSAYFYSPYKTVTQKTTVHTGTRSVESFSPVKPSVQSDSSVVYGPYENVEGNLTLFPLGFCNNSFF